MSAKEYPAFDPHGDLTPTQRGCMTLKTRMHINGAENPTNQMSDGRFHSNFGFVCGPNRKKEQAK